jgi:hypothetical protein
VHCVLETQPRTQTLEPGAFRAVTDNDEHGWETARASYLDHRANEIGVPFFSRESSNGKDDPGACGQAELVADTSAAHDSA